MVHVGVLAQRSQFQLADSALQLVLLDAREADAHADFREHPRVPARADRIVGENERPAALHPPAQDDLGLFA